MSRAAVLTRQAHVHCDDRGSIGKGSVALMTTIPCCSTIIRAGGPFSFPGGWKVAASAATVADDNGSGALPGAAGPSHLRPILGRSHKFLQQKAKIVGEERLAIAEAPIIGRFAFNPELAGASSAGLLITRNKRRQATCRTLLRTDLVNVGRSRSHCPERGDFKPPPELRQ